MIEGVRKNLIFLLLFIPFLLGAIKPLQYKTLSDKSFYTYEQTDDGRVYRPKLATYDADFVNREYGIAHVYLTRFASKHNLPLKKCQNRDLHVFVVGMDIVNDLDRYPTMTNEVSERWAIYDPYNTDNGLAAILVTDHSSSTIDKILLTHELGHYWFDEYCWQDDWKGSTESFAIAFQDYYTLDRFGRRY